MSVKTDPEILEMLTTWELPLGFTVDLSDGVTVTDATSALFDIKTGHDIALDDEPTVENNTIAQWIRGTQLKSGHRYRLTVDYTLSTEEVAGGVLLIIVPS